MITRNQLELGIEPVGERRRAVRRRRGLPGARWWFAQMHRIVDEAGDWATSPPRRAEQPMLELNARN